MEELLRKFDFGPLNFSSEFMITCPNPILVHFSIARISDFGQGSYLHKFRREIEWTKIEFSKPVRMNSFKHFFWSKKDPRVMMMRILMKNFSAGSRSTSDSKTFAIYFPLINRSSWINLYNPEKCLFQIKFK